MSYTNCQTHNTPYPCRFCSNTAMMKRISELEHALKEAVEAIEHEINHCRECSETNCDNCSECTTNKALESARRVLK